MTIADKLSLLASTKTAIAAAIEAKGTPVAGLPFADYPAKIAELRGGGIEIGECVFMQDQPEALLQIGDATFLKSGNVITVTDEIEYSEALEAFGSPGNDLDVWLPIEAGFDETVNSMAYGEGMWVAVYGNGSVARSYDGLSWTHSKPTTMYIYCVAYGDGLWIMAGMFGGIYTSTDGITWTSGGPFFEGTTILSVAYGDGKWIAVGGGPGKWAISSDGIIWEWFTDPGFGTTYINHVIYRNGLWVAGGQMKLATSTDGITWTQQTVDFDTSAIIAVDYGGGLWVAGGNAGAISTSPDGVVWTRRTSAISSTITALVYANGLWVATAKSGKLASSADGINWISHVSGFGTLDIASLAYGEGIWSIAGYAHYAVSLPYTTLGLPAETKDGASVQYMRIK